MALVDSRLRGNDGYVSLATIIFHLIKSYRERHATNRKTTES